MGGMGLGVDVTVKIIPLSLAGGPVSQPGDYPPIHPPSEDDQDGGSQPPFAKAQFDEGPPKDGGMIRYR